MNLGLKFNFKLDLQVKQYKNQWKCWLWTNFDIEKNKFYLEIKTIWFKFFLNDGMMAVEGLEKWMDASSNSKLVSN